MKSTGGRIVLALLMTGLMGGAAEAREEPRAASGEPRQGTSPIEDAGYSSKALERSKLESRSAQRPGDYFITARNGFLIGGEGATGDVLQIDGKIIWEGPGQVSIFVDESTNTGEVDGDIATHDHFYSVNMKAFREKEHYQDGGIARDIFIHGATGHGLGIMPTVYAWLAGWGPCTVSKDGAVLYENFECEFMVTEAVRDPITHAMIDFPTKEQVHRLIDAQMQNEVKDPDTKEIEQRVRLAWNSVDKNRAEVHIVAHSKAINSANLPPYEKAMHFMWERVKWWGPGVGNRPIQEQRWRYQGEDYEPVPLVPAMTAEHKAMAKRSVSQDERLLMEAINRKLYYDPFVNANQVLVRAEGKKVSLAGQVEDPTAFYSAVEDACKAGAEEVYVHLTIEPPFDAFAFSFGVPMSEEVTRTTSGSTGHEKGVPYEPVQTGKRTWTCVKGAAAPHEKAYPSPPRSSEGHGTRGR